MKKLCCKNNYMDLLFYAIALLYVVQIVFLPGTMSYLRVFINYVLLLPPLGFLLLLFRRKSIAIAIHSAMIYLFYYADRSLMSIRLAHLRYSDFFCVQDAVRVLDRYSMPIGRGDVLLLLALVGLNLIFYPLSFRQNREKESRTEVAVVGLVIALLTGVYIVGGVCYHWIPDTTDYLTGVFDSNKTTETDGLFYTLYNQFRNSRIKEPEWYSENLAKSILSNYEEDAGVPEEPVQIIVIMNESLTDYDLIGKTVFSQDPLPNIHNPDNSFFEGKLAVSVYAGYTCNTEYEFLTGHSLRFMPPMYVPYSQLIVKDTPSMAWDFRLLGMSAQAIHPFYSQEWNRRNVYPCLGFERFIAGEDFSQGLVAREQIDNITDAELNRLDFGSDLEYIRGFISDEECYRKVLEALDNNRRQPDFIFAVTVQNHGGYTYQEDDFQSMEFVAGEEEMNQYLTCANKSDEAFANLIHALSLRPEKTVVLMFGDHQPGLTVSDCVEGYDDSSENIYYVPYVVWSNFTPSQELPEVLSANYLSAVLKRYAGLPLSAWDKLRLETMEFYPVLTGWGALDKNYIPGESQDSIRLKRYEIVQYYRITSGKS